MANAWISAPPAHLFEPPQQGIGARGLNQHRCDRSDQCVVRDPETCRGRRVGIEDPLVDGSRPARSRRWTTAGDSGSAFRVRAGGNSPVRWRLALRATDAAFQRPIARAPSIGLLREARVGSALPGGPHSSSSSSPSTGFHALSIVTARACWCCGVANACGRSVPQRVHSLSNDPPHHSSGDAFAGEYPFNSCGMT